jgi:acetylornithine deacetylase/succinyl-diaminopimelate desuccinylase-like protein
MTAAPAQPWLERALATVSAEELIDLTARMVDVPSPTGEERALAEFVVDYLRRAGLEAAYQPMDDEQGNAIGRYRGEATDGASLLIHAPLDTVFGGPAEEDAPFLGVPPRRDQIAEAEVEDGWIVGAGAHNPKGHAACAILAAIALRRAGVPLNGDLILGFCAGGMPTNRRPNVAARRNGHGAGLAFMLEQGVRGDFAIMAKPGAPTWEEVGLAWFRIRVKGVLGYAGTRHAVKHRNPILEAARLIGALEEWFPQYTRNNTSGLVAPQGSIGCIRAGWPYKPTFIPETCELYVDLRVSPRTDPTDVRRQFAEAIDRIGRENRLELEWDMILAIPGTATDERNWIVQSAIRAYEAMTGGKFAPQTGTSGATEANILRLWGIPTARMGLPPPSGPGAFGGMFSTGEVHIDSMMKLVHGYLYVAIDTCARPRADLGL